jgi:chromate transport protein ChrA
MKRKNIILWLICALTVVSTVALVVLEKNPFTVIFLGCFVMFLVYALLPVPPKHKDFSYEDQQRAFRAFDRTDLIDPGKPDWAKRKK